VNIKNVTALINERIFVIVVTLILCGALWASYSFYREGKLLEQEISSKQNELARVLQLKNIYLSSKYDSEKIRVRKDGQRSFSLSSIEEGVTKTFTAGKLTMLKPSTLKDQRSAGQPSIELKINGAVLNEAVSFLKTLEASNLIVKKLYLTVPQNQAAIDMYIVITER